MPKNSLLLKELPADVRKILLMEQAEHQVKCNCRFSKEKTMYLIARRWAKIKNFQHNGIAMSKIAEEM